MEKFEEGTRRKIAYGWARGGWKQQELAGIKQFLWRQASKQRDGADSVQASPFYNLLFLFH